MKVHELITMLQQYDPSVEVVGTWEGQEEKLGVYRAADGRVIIDADSNNYKLQWQETKCVVCGKQARGTPFADKPVCLDHWCVFDYEKETQ